jgi:hypothetical protein
VQTAGSSSRPVALVSYGTPVIARVSGCVDAGDTTDNCPRRGAAVVTLTGANFGNSGAQVLVGGAGVCSNVTHSPASPHTVVTFLLPPGVNAAASVMLAPASGSFSLPATFSYAQCRPGWYQASSSDYDCTPCPAGSFSKFSGSPLCSPCATGTFSASTGLSVCVDCSAGRFADLPGMTSCEPCGPGTFAAQSGSRECVVCAWPSFVDTVTSSKCSVLGW